MKTNSVELEAQITGPGGFVKTGNGSLRAAQLDGSAEQHQVARPGDNAREAQVVEAGGITKSGAGTLLLGAANSFAGPVAVNEGVVHIQNNTSLGTTAAGTTVADGATLQIEFVGALAEPLNSIQGAGRGGTLGVLNLMAATGGGACESCLVVSGMFTTNASTLLTPLAAEGSPSVCHPPKLCPGPFPIPLPPTPFHLYSFTNTSSTQACVTAQLHFDCPAEPRGALHVAAYLGAVDPNNPCMNYLGDSGGDGTAGFSFPVPAGSNAVLLVTSRAPNIGCDAYTLELFGLPCPPPPLHIVRDSTPNKVLLQWSSAYPEYHLQSANSLDGPGSIDFNNITTPPVLVGGKFAVTNGVAAPRQFFRLEAR